MSCIHMLGWKLLIYFISISLCRCKRPSEFCLLLLLLLLLLSTKNLRYDEWSKNHQSCCCCYIFLTFSLFSYIPILCVVDVAVRVRDSIKQINNGVITNTIFLFAKSKNFQPVFLSHTKLLHLLLNTYLVGLILHPDTNKAPSTGLIVTGQCSLICVGTVPD